MIDTLKAVCGAIATALIFSWLHRVLSGWDDLERPYRGRVPRTAVSLGWHKLWLGSSRILNFPSRLAADSEALYLQAFPLFWVGNPALRIPWSDLELREERSSKWLSPWVVRFRLTPQVRWRLTESVASRLTGAAGAAWR
jgi:hypothetical protein